MRRVPALAALAFASTVGLELTARAQAQWTTLRDTDRTALASALDVLNLTTNDPGFLKDVAEPRWALARVRRLLASPLEFPELADEAMRAAAEPARGDFAVAARWLELPVAESLPEVAGPTGADGEPVLDPRLMEALRGFAAAAQRARARIDHAFAQVAGEDRVYAAASTLAGNFLAGDHPDLQPLLSAAGMPEPVVAGTVAEERLIDPEPGVSRYLGVCAGVRIEDVLAAAAGMRQAVDDLQVSGEPIAWPTAVCRLEVAGTRIVVGTVGDDRFDQAAALILDPGGNDLYTAAAGRANGLLGQPLSVVFDLSGDDRYVGSELLGPGAALFGVALLVDGGGADAYGANYVGAGAGIFGVAYTEDLAGDDAYQAQSMAQGAGVVGFGCLRDAAGNDRYDLGFIGQGYAGVRGVGLLIDQSGNDRYAAGGVRVDYDRNEDRYLSVAQGCAVGMRPYAGGGVAALVDLAGNDAYEADVFGQGVGYWYAAGMLLDGGGQDSYQLFQYGQGSGIHLSLGLLADGGGRDMYTGYILCQGNAHDYAVGWLIDQGGDDTYTGDHFVQGRAINNACAVLLDSAGDDAYLARQPDQAQGLGDNGGDREYGSVALILDLAGTDRYTCGATNGASTERPDFGVIFDRAAESAKGEP
ncbi:MAG: hypothetical protein K8T26_15690 [Lentisphaerae bacterium]|nr:hypothetical protein [Lentisphaerota bacterium]